jgi:hypothetical protein
MKLRLDKTIKAGDVLTSLTVALSAIALVLSLARDRDSRTLEQANRVRAAAASAVVKLDRWQAVELSLYQELQPLFVELSEDFGRKYDVVAVRDKFWRQVNVERTKIARQVLEEQLGTAYLDITAHVPAARLRYQKALLELGRVEAQVTSEFLAGGEDAILGMPRTRANYHTATLGNALREQADRSLAALKEQSDRVLSSLREFLLSVIALPDAEIAGRVRLDVTG